MQLLAPKEVCQRIGICRVKLWEMTKEGNFPRPVTIVGRRIGYVESEVEAWIKSRIAERDREAA